MSAQRRPPKGSSGRGAFDSAISVGGRLWHAWGVLDRDQRRAAAASVALFVTMLLPWYSKQDTAVIKGQPKVTQFSLSAFDAFSFVEAAVLLVAVFVLCVLFFRAERRAFHLPGGDGLIVMLAGAWAAILIFYRLLDKPSLQGTERITATVGVKWGIFIALLVAIGLAYTGGRLRAAGRPEPALTAADEDDHEPPDEAATVAASPLGAANRVRRRADVGARPPVGREPTAEPEPMAERPRYPPAPSPDRSRRRSPRMVTREDAAQLSFEDPALSEPVEDDLPKRRRR